MFDFLNPDTLTTAVAVACFAVGAWLGSWFPDIDQKIGFLRHRSIVTHGFLLPCLLLIGVGATRLERVDWFIAGFATGVAVHLAFDLFPESWRGYALITVPGAGGLSRNISRAWLALSVFVCLSISTILTTGQVGIVAYNASIAALFLYGITMKREPVVGPMLTLIALGAFASTWTFATDGIYFRDLIPV